MTALSGRSGVFLGALVAALAVATAGSPSPAHGSPIVFDFSNEIPGTTATPFDQTVDGVTATFTSDQDPGGFEVDTSPFATFTGLMVDSPGPAFGPGALLTVTFSQPVDDVSIPFATDGTGPLMLSATAFGGASLGGTSASGLVPAGPYVFPEGVISFSVADIGSVTLFDSNDPFFAIGPVLVDVTVPAPEPAGASLLGLALAGLALARRRASSRL